MPVPAAHPEESGDLQVLYDEPLPVVDGDPLVPCLAIGSQFEISMDQAVPSAKHSRGTIKALYD